MMRSFISPGLKAGFAIACWLSLSGLACPIFCEDQTNIQVSYRDARDLCRAEAEKKVGALTNEKQQNTKMVGLFSECMQRAGWDVPGPGNAAAPKPAAEAATASAPAAAGVAVYSAADHQRAAECAWARQNAATDAVAYTRAQACDIECRQRMQMNPSLRPAACASQYPEDRLHKRMMGNMTSANPPAAGTIAAVPAAKPVTQPKKKVVKKKKPAAKKPAAVAPAKPAETVPTCPQISPQDVLDDALNRCPRTVTPDE